MALLNAGLWGRDRSGRLWRFVLRQLILKLAVHEVGRRGHGGAGVERCGNSKLGQRSSYIKVRCVAHRDGVHLARGNQAAQHFAHLAARGQRREEQFDLFHAGGDHSLQIDGGEHRDRSDLRGGGAFGNGFLETVAQQLPLGGLSDGGDGGDDAKLLPELGNGAQNGHFSDFAAQGMGELGNVCIAQFQLLVGLHSQLRNLAGAGQLRAAAPVAVASEGIDVG
jgi:hypothetical protein